MTLVNIYMALGSHDMQFDYLEKKVIQQQPQLININIAQHDEGLEHNTSSTRFI